MPVGGRRGSCTAPYELPEPDTPWMKSARPPLAWGMWKRFLIAGVLIVALSARRDGHGRAEHRQRDRRRGVPEAQPDQRARRASSRPNTTRRPETFLILGTDRREGSKDSYDREDPPHSDTILLVRFDPAQGQTSVLSIPRDLIVNITLPRRPDLPQGKDQRRLHDRQPSRGHPRRDAAGGGNDQAGSVPRTDSSTAIVDVNFKGFIRVVDTLGCAYVNVDHRYYNENVGTPETNYTEHQPAARLPEAVLRKRARLRPLQAHGLRLRAGGPPAGLPARPARAGQPRATCSARSTPSPKPSATRSPPPSRLGAAN